MKKLSFILTLLFSNVLTIFAQSLPQFKVGSEENSAFYLNTVNNIAIQLNDADPSKIQIKGLKNAPSKLNDSLYQVRFTKAIEEVKLKLYYKNFPVDVKTFLVKQLELPAYTLNDFAPKELNLGELLKDQIELKLPEGIALNTDLKIYTFQLTIKDPKKKLFRTNLRNNVIPKNIVQLIRKSSSGTKIELSKFRYRSGKGNVFEIKGAPLVYDVKL